MFGYIEKEETEQKINLYNSVGIINRKGEMELNVRKTHLYYADKYWCEEG